MRAIYWTVLLGTMLVLGFWRLTPWSWIVRMVQLPGGLVSLLSLPEEERQESIELGLDFLTEARQDGRVWIPGVVWSLFQKLRSKP